DQSDDYSIDGKGIMLRRSGNNSTIYAEIENGIKDFSVDLKKAFTNNQERTVELFINDESKGTYTLDNNNNGVQNFKVKDINIEGKFKLEIRHASGGSRNAQITVDNITWTSYDGSTEKKNLLENGDFEEWENGLPVGWFGAKSNIAKSKVNKTNTGAKDGDYAVQLAETGSSHKRFTSKPISIKKDVEYTLTYWVKGKGEIRNAFFRDGGYSQYTDYTILDTD